MSADASAPNRAATERLLDELASSSAHPAAVGGLRTLILEGTDFDCYKMNAFRLARTWSIDRGDCLRSLLFATRLGILDLSWDVHCPSCYGIPAYHKHLMALRDRAHCPLCRIDWDLDFGDQVEVTFTVNPELRPIVYPDWVDRDFAGMMSWLDDILTREGRELTVGGCVNPGERAEFVAEIDEGEYEVYMPSHRERGFPLVVAGERESSERIVSVRGDADGRLHPRELALRPGPVRFVVDYDYPEFNGFLVVSTAARRNWVSAAHVMAQQDFRDLFGGEFLAPDVSFAIRSVTLLFTDITGSTAMYERLGDGPAYATVQEHFRLMTEIIRRHEGGIVKTIGDAVMAAFPVNRSAVVAACEIQRAFAAQEETLRDVTVKIGLHRGPCIAVTNARAIDYFGRTANVAARVQGESGPGEVLLSPAVATDPSVAAYLDEADLRPLRREARLKGIDEALALVVLRPGRFAEF